jgi:hypothetical protein
MYIKIFVITFLITSLSFILPQQKIEIENYSFELSENKIPAGWTSEGNIITDETSSKSGSSSLMVEHNSWKSTTIFSSPLELKTGHLYKLTAWIKSENAVTNPVDRYPTPVAACIAMESFPFTNHSSSVGATNDWTKVEVNFIATSKKDRVKLIFGSNGKTIGRVWFDNVELNKVEDITEYIPFENVKWFNNGYRYDDKGWIFVHIEGAPYERGYQYGNLVAEEISEYINKLGIQKNKDNPEKAWNDLRFIADAFMLRKYDDEYINEMKGIADGANNTGVKIFNRKFDLVDIVTVNSVIDIDYSKDAMNVTPNILSGHNFLKSEDELNIPNRLHKCSSFLANNSSTTDGRILFGQLFMWGGYTGAHWNIICDVEPTDGHRLVYQTFPGGIHSGADFYINDSGIMIGETTVAQTPFNPDGSPQSNRIRKAAQYGESIDDVVKILTTNNNGMYTNDWLIGDTKNDEIAVLLLGTNKYKLWRSTENDFYGDTKDFYWCNNNSKDPEVKKEYISNPENAPYDLIFAPWNRDIAFNEFYNEYKGRMDATAGINLIASSPINRPHACDGKITTSEMAQNLVFLAHFGKVTLREKFVGVNNRIPDLPGATPHLSLGYSVVSPVFITQKLKKLRDKRMNTALTKETEKRIISGEIINKYKYESRNLWINTVYPASESVNWFVSGTAAYWQFLKNIPAEENEVLIYNRDRLADLNCRYLYIIDREGTIKPVDAKRIYTKYNNYQIPRIKGTYLLHQLRLYLGNNLFSDVMNKVHDTYREKEMTTENFITIAEEVSGGEAESLIRQWIERDDLPEVSFSYSAFMENGRNKVNITLKQNNDPYHFLCAVKINTASNEIYKLIEIKKSEETFVLDSEDEVLSVDFNPLEDIPHKTQSYYTWSNIFDDWKSAKIVYGTGGQIEANHTLALRFSTALADRFTEDLIPVVKESELNESDLKNNDLVIIGGIEDNNLLKRISEKLNLKIGKNNFEWNNKNYTRSDDGLYLSLPNPYNDLKVVYLFISNSALELYQMTKTILTMPQWAIFKGDKIVEKGYFN